MGLCNKAGLTVFSMYGFQLRTGFQFAKRMIEFFREFPITRPFFAETQMVGTEGKIAQREIFEGPPILV